MTDSITIRQPDDWHLHLRDGPVLKQVVGATARHFARAIIMPNLVPPVTDVAQAAAYHERIIAALPEDSPLQPLMALYLTEQTSPQDVQAAHDSDVVYAFKYYPAGATTHSDAGVRDIENLFATIEAMAELGIPLLVHGEVTNTETDIFDREARFIDDILAPLLERIPGLRLVLEHVSTAHGIEYVRSREKNLAATITPQHLYMNRNAMLAGGIRPHNYCLPVLKRETDRLALVDAATSGDQRFFLGTDSAPHVRSAKENACGCAGTFNSPAALAVYAQVFDTAGALANLEKFTSINGPDFYGLPVNDGSMTLYKKPWRVPDNFASGEEIIVPWLAGEKLNWQVAET